MRRPISKAFVILSLFMGTLLLFSLGHTEDYYVKNGGDNGAAGTSDALAWETFAYAKAQTYSAGDTIHFKRGNTFSVALYGDWRPGQSGNSGNYITIDAYGTGNKPIISSIETLFGSWTLHDTNIWKKTVAANNVHRVWLDGVESGKPSAVGGIDGTTYLWYYSSATLYVYATQNPDDEYTTVEMMQEIKTFLFEDDSYWKVQNVELRGSIYFYGTCSYVEINNVDIYRSKRGVYSELTDSADTVTYITVDGCDIDAKPNLISKVITEAEMPLLDGISLMKACSNWTIKNNTIRDHGHAGVDIYATDAAYNGCHGNIVENNEFYGNNSPYMRGFGCSGHDTKATGNIFRYNLIAHTNIRNQLGGNNNEVYYNLIYETEESPVTNKSDVSQGLLLQTGSSKVCADNKIYNNVFYGIHNEGIWIDNTVPLPTGNLIKNNIVMDASRSTFHPNIQIMFDADVPNSNLIQNNLFYDADTSDTVKYKGPIYTVAYADANFDEFSNSLAVDPHMTDPANNNFTLLMASPCIDAGWFVGPALGTLNYDNLTGSFTLLERIIGGTSGATAKVLTDSGSVLTLENCNGCFNDNEQITGGSSGATANVNHPDGAVGADKLVKNGAFVHNIDPPNDWLWAGATLTTDAGGQVGNCMTVLDDGSTFRYGYQQTSALTIGKIYRWSFYHKNGTGTLCQVNISATHPTSAEYYIDNHNDAAWTVHTGTFEAITTTCWISLRSTQAGNSQLFDEITFYELTPFAEDYQGLKIRHAPDIGAHENQTNVLFFPAAKLFRRLYENYRNNN